jgi:hypothetical protein
MATVTVSIPSKLADKLQRGASRRGVSMDEFIVEALERGIPVNLTDDVPHLTSDESELLQEINEGLPAQSWDEYNALIRARDEEALTSGQHKRLIDISNHIELQNSRRIGALAKLAKIRHVSLTDLMDTLGIPQPDNG